MKQFSAFFKKELTEHIRSGRVVISVIIFAVIGIMNPAIAKLTPWIIEAFADTLAESGMTVTSVTVTAMDSWMQFFKNLPIGIIAFVILISGVYTKEYQSGTLILTLTKGLDRYKVIVAKSVVLLLLWAVCYWLSFAITYAYNSFFWDNSVAANLLYSIIFPWIFGIFLISLLTLASSLLEFNTGVLVFVGGAVVLSYAVGFIPTVSDYVPTHLLDGTSLIYSKVSPSDYLWSAIITAILSVVNFIGSVFAFNKKQL
jgi:ABC-2 type transport system permease protein